LCAWFCCYLARCAADVNGSLLRYVLHPPPTCCSAPVRLHQLYTFVRCACGCTTRHPLFIAFCAAATFRFTVLDVLLGSLRVLLQFLFCCGCDYTIAAVVPPPPFVFYTPQLDGSVVDTAPFQFAFVLRIFRTVLFHSFLLPRCTVPLRFVQLRGSLIHHFSFVRRAALRLLLHCTCCSFCACSFYSYFLTPCAVLLQFFTQFCTCATAIHGSVTHLHAYSAHTPHTIIFAYAFATAALTLVPFLCCAAVLDYAVMPLSPVRCCFSPFTTAAPFAPFWFCAAIFSPCTTAALSGYSPQLVT